MTRRPWHAIERRPVTRMGNGHHVELVIHRLTGAEPGPTLLLLGGIHGDEANGVEQVRRIVMALSAIELAGTVVAVPVANPYAYDAMTRSTPADGLNLNRIFPGDPRGSLTEQLAAALTELIVEADILIDFHSAGQYATVDYTYVMAADPRPARFFGHPLMYLGDVIPNTTAAIAVRHGVATMVSELGGGGQYTEHYLNRAIAGTLRVLAGYGMTPEPGQETYPAAAAPLVVTGLQLLRPTAGGALLSSIDPRELGEQIAGGTELGVLLDPYTFEVIEDFHAPYESNLVVLTRERYTRAVPGDYGFMLADATTASTADVVFGPLHPPCGAR